MPQYSINTDGSRTIHSRYSKKGISTLKAIFPSTKETSEKYLKKKKESESVNLQKKYSVHDNSMLVRNIFSSFLLKILSRVSDGDIFMLPGATKANITLKQIPEKEVKKLRQKGFYSDYDIVKADFKIPKFSFDFGPYSNKRDVGIYVPSSIKNNALNRAQNKEIAWTYIPKTFDRDVRYE